jgi:hypothetical protein
VGKYVSGKFAPAFEVPVDDEPLDFDLFNIYEDIPLIDRAYMREQGLTCERMANVVKRRFERTGKYHRERHPNGDYKHEILYEESLQKFGAGDKAVVPNLSTLFDTFSHNYIRKQLVT